MDDIALTLVSVPNPAPGGGHFNQALLGTFSQAPKEQSGSGQSVAIFCRDRGLTTGQFFAWKQRLRRAAEEQFVEVQVERTATQATPKTRNSAIEVHLAEGRRILVEPGFDAEHLRAVVAALEAR